MDLLPSSIAPGQARKQAAVVRPRLLHTYARHVDRRFHFPSPGRIRRSCRGSVGPPLRALAPFLRSPTGGGRSGAHPRLAFPRSKGGRPERVGEGYASTVGCGVWIFPARACRPGLSTRRPSPCESHPNSANLAHISPFAAYVNGVGAAAKRTKARFRPSRRLVEEAAQRASGAQLAMHPESHLRRVCPPARPVEQMQQMRNSNEQMRPWPTSRKPRHSGQIRTNAANAACSSPASKCPTGCAKFARECLSVGRSRPSVWATCPTTNGIQMGWS